MELPLDSQACSFFGAGCKPKMKTWFGQYWLGLVRLLAQEEQAAPADCPGAQCSAGSASAFPSANWELLAAAGEAKDEAQLSLLCDKLQALIQLQLKASQSHRDEARVALVHAVSTVGPAGAAGRWSPLAALPSGVG